MIDCALAFQNCRTIADSVATLKGLLREAGLGEFERDARDLICAAFNVAQIDLILRGDALARPEDIAKLIAFARRRLDREPVTRIIGARGFWTFDLAVHPHVLDPRSDTEILIEACVAAMAGRVNEPISILDVGTGSGALIAALLSEFPQARGVAIDVSPHAIAAAHQNLSKLGLGDRALLLQQSWSEPLPQTFDLVVSNPPYIASAEIADLDPEVKAFDPALALDGGVDGLDAYRAIAGRWRDWLNPGGLLGLEIGATQSIAVCRLFASAGGQLADQRQDYAGHDRALIWAREVV